MDMNEITMNLVPFPGMHFLTSSMSPLIGYKDMGKLMGSTSSIDQVIPCIIWAIINCAIVVLSTQGNLR